MYKHKLIIFSIALLTSYSVCAFDFDWQKALKTGTDVVQKVQQANKPLTEAQEIQLGHGIASNLLGAAPLLDNKQVQSYVNQVGRWVSLQTERPDLPWEFGVLDSNDLNAFATPGGTIFITKGLMQHLTNESELAGVLAHEMKTPSGCIAKIRQYEHRQRSGGTNTRCQGQPGVGQGHQSRYGSLCQGTG
jgi:predicted Zn-dependent protease